MNKDNANRILGNLASVPMYTATINKAEVEYLMGELSGTVICNGRLRQLVTAPITDNLFSIKSEAMFG